MTPATQGDAWVSAIDGLECRRKLEPTDGREYLVTVRFKSKREGDLMVRVVEELPADVTSVSVLTTPGGDPDACRWIGDWIVHEPWVPETADRSTVYLLETEDGIEPAMPPLQIAEVEPTADSRPPPAAENRSAKVAIDEAGDDSPMEISLPSDTPVEESGGREPSAIRSGERNDIIDVLLRELQTEQSGDRREKLQEALGVAPSERARFVHLQSRMDDLAAYVKVLEQLVDEHGLDVIEEMQSSIETNAQHTASLREDLDHVEITIDRQRAAIDDELGSIRTDLDAQQTEIEHRLRDVESALTEATSAITDLQNQRRKDLHTRARTVRRIDRSLSTLQETLDGLSTDLEEVSTAVEMLEEDVASITAELEATSANVQAVGSDLEETERDVSAVREQLTQTNSDVQTVHRELEMLRSAIEDVEAAVGEFETFRDRFRSALSPDTGPPARDATSEDAQR